MITMHETLTGLIVSILSGNITTALIEFIPSETYTHTMKNNITGVTANFYQCNIPCVVVDSMMFGDDNIFPESLDHANSLLGDDTTFKNNHIILSSHDDLNISHIYDSINKCKNILSPTNDIKIKLTTVYSDGHKEEKYGVVASSNRN